MCPRRKENELGVTTGKDLVLAQSVTVSTFLSLCHMEHMVRGPALRVSKGESIQASRDVLRST
jgi:hypothetical protein